MPVSDYIAKFSIHFHFRDASVPPPPAGHKWKAVQHDNKVEIFISPFLCKAVSLSIENLHAFGITFLLAQCSMFAAEVQYL